MSQKLSPDWGILKKTRNGVIKKHFKNTITQSRIKSKYQIIRNIARNKIIKYYPVLSSCMGSTDLILAIPSFYIQEWGAKKRSLKIRAA